eukprot:symbB.v1.2.038076.t1/scaffold5811.1/size23414/1
MLARTGPRAVGQKSKRRSGSCRELRSALQQVDVGRERGDFCAERFRVDCADLLEQEEQPHCLWLTTWHQRLLSAISDAEKGPSTCGSSSVNFPGWKEFKQLVLKSTEEVVQIQKLLEDKASTSTIFCSRDL